MWTILVAICVVALCATGLAIKLLVRKEGKFPAIHIRESEEMRRKGIGCVKEEEMERERKMRGLKTAETVGTLGALENMTRDGSGKEEEPEGKKQEISAKAGKSDNICSGCVATCPMRR
ncbi:MAG: hypothetical protein LBS12_00265 [Prevotellaceae bacterium]|jgi:hypothetical protein|nr:hypothetical protein [Prevotellaceae bacterium]